ncbi:MAG TPA: glycosyltransferase [Bdellovibrionota bacterium]|jgi:glycosyltransferase involved in cell wall biosynthesis|nr:glycosyltransferase [Bdellovibrionota bacterium]
MKVSGFTLVRHGARFDYPFMESLRSLAPLVDELVINVGIGEDETLDRIKAFVAEAGAGPDGSPKVRWFESRWPLDDPEKKKGGLILSEQTNLALDRCTGDWCIYLQADEVFHEADRALIREAIREYDGASGIDALLFEYVHLYGSFDVVQDSRGAYRREVRCIRRASGARSVGDAQSFRGPGGKKLGTAFTGARVFHYGWVRTPEAMKAKTTFMDTLYHGDYKADATEPHTGDNYRYKRFWGLKPYGGDHPAVMAARIRSHGWKWDLARSPLEWRFADLPKRLLDLWEYATGWRMFEYRSYRLLNRTRAGLWRRPVSTDAPAAPAASVILSTYEMPFHLERVLAGLEGQSTRDFEVVVCDDGSGPETQRIIRDFADRVAPGVRVEHCWQKNEGFRKSRILNEGVRRSKGRTLIFLDGDCVPHRHFVRDHLQNQEPGRYLAGRRVECGKDFTARASATDVRRGLFDGPSIRFLRSVLGGESQYFNRTWRVSWGPLRKLLGMERVVDLKGCNYSVSREDFYRINGYDEAYVGYGREDGDVEIRLKNLGLKIKSLKGLALQFHLWHPRREFTPANDVLMDEADRLNRVRCERGMVS